jgi:hypothetical protein
MRQNHDSQDENRSGIGTLNENSLHAEIIASLSRPGDNFEADLNGFIIDILRGTTAIEVQTRGLEKLIRKLRTIPPDYQFQVVYPITQTKFIIKLDQEGQAVSRRKSPKQGRLVEIFNELVHAPTILNDPHISLVILLVEAEEIWIDDGQGSWRRKRWSIHERRLIRIIDQRIFHSPEDLLDLLPQSLATPFTNKELAASLRIPARLAGKITYTLRKMGLLDVISRAGHAFHFDYF